MMCATLTADQQVQKDHKERQGLQLHFQLEVSKQQTLTLWQVLRIQEVEPIIF